MQTGAQGRQFTSCEAAKQLIGNHVFSRQRRLVGAVGRIVQDPGNPPFLAYCENRSQSVRTDVCAEFHPPRFTGYP